MRDFAPTWLCPEPADRERLLEVDEHLRSAQTGFWAALSVALLAFIPRYGFAPLAPLLAAVAGAALMRRFATGRVAPEYVIAGIAVSSQAMLAIGIGMSGGASSPGLPLMLLAATLTPARFKGRGMVVLLGVAVALMVIPSVVVDPHALIASPELLVACICGMIGLAPIVAALSGSERERRAEATLDPLTGLPNRRALDARLPVMARDAQTRGAVVALMTCDLDHFKVINDTHGHVRGDRVLQAVADTLRGAVRGSDNAYRWGGEEFVVVALVANESAARHAAERVRTQVAGANFDGLALTLSIGVAVIRTAAELKDAFVAADAALYRAKALGRNRVVVAGDAADGELIELPSDGAAARRA
jgi:diguanylate cyclase (GGDEF)-like protein